MAATLSRWIPVVSDVWYFALPTRELVASAPPVLCLLDNEQCHDWSVGRACLYRAVSTVVDDWYARRTPVWGFHNVRSHCPPSV